jgi:hypothetical protein
LLNPILILDSETVKGDPHLTAKIGGGLIAGAVGLFIIGFIVRHYLRRRFPEMKQTEELDPWAKIWIRKPKKASKTEQEEHHGSTTVHVLPLKAVPSTPESIDSISKSLSNQTAFQTH